MVDIWHKKLDLASRVVKLETQNTNLLDKVTELQESVEKLSDYLKESQEKQNEDIISGNLKLAKISFAWSVAQALGAVAGVVITAALAYWRYS